MAWFHPKTLLDKTYEIGLFIKAFDGLVELIGGALVLTLSSSTITGITKALTDHALQEDPHSFVANHIARAGHHLASGQNLFAALFLLTHGLVKVVLVVCLLLNKLWAYPWALVVLTLFAVYQVYLLIDKPGIGMAILLLLDIGIIYLVWREWKKVRADRAGQAATS